MTIGLGDGRSACIKSSGVFIRGKRVHRFRESAGNSVSNVNGSNGELWINGELVVPRRAGSSAPQRGNRMQNVVMGTITSGVPNFESSGSSSDSPPPRRRGASVGGDVHGEVHISDNGDVQIGSRRTSRQSRRGQRSRRQTIVQTLGVGGDPISLDDFGVMLGALRRQFSEGDRRRRRRSHVNKRRSGERKKK